MARTARGEGFFDVAGWFEALAHTKRAHLERIEAVRAAIEVPK
jgi:hypothetical protein